MKKILIISLLSVFLFGLQYSLWFSSAGIPKLNHLAKLLKIEKASIDKLAFRNQKMDLEVQALKRSPEALEEQARAELGMIKQGETFYLVTVEKPKQ